VSGEGNGGNRNCFPNFPKRETRKTVFIYYLKAIHLRNTTLQMWFINLHFFTFTVFKEKIISSLTLINFYFLLCTLIFILLLSFNSREVFKDHFGFFKNSFDFSPDSTCVFLSYCAETGHIEMSRLATNC
jgi:hypothetical protein